MATCNWKRYRNSTGSDIQNVIEGKFKFVSFERYGILYEEHVTVYYRGSDRHALSIHNS